MLGLIWKWREDIYQYQFDSFVQIWKIQRLGIFDGAQLFRKIEISGFFCEAVFICFDLWDRALYNVLVNPRGIEIPSKTKRQRCSRQKTLSCQ